MVSEHMEPISNLELARKSIGHARSALRMPEAKRLYNTVDPAAVNAHAIVQVMEALILTINAVECLLVPRKEQT